MVTLVQILVWVMVIGFTYIAFSGHSSRAAATGKVLGALTNAIYTLVNSTNMQWNRHHNTTMENNNLLRTMPATTIWTFVGAVIQWATPLLWILLWPLWLHVRQQQYVQGFVSAVSLTHCDTCQRAMSLV